MLLGVRVTAPIISSPTYTLGRWFGLLSKSKVVTRGR